MAGRFFGVRTARGAMSAAVATVRPRPALCLHLFVRGNTFRVLVRVPRRCTAVPLLGAALNRDEVGGAARAGAAPGARPGLLLTTKVTLWPRSLGEQVVVLAMVLCVAMLPHDTVLISVPDAGALGGGDGSPAEAYDPADMREGLPMPPGTRKTPLNVEELEKRVDDMVTGLEEQVQERERGKHRSRSNGDILQSSARPRLSHSSWHASPDSCSFHHSFLVVRQLLRVRALLPRIHVVCSSVLFVCVTILCLCCCHPGCASILAARSL